MASALEIILGADAAGYIEALKHAKEATDKAAKDMEDKAKDSGKSILGSWTQAFSFGAAIAGFKMLISEVDNLKESADSIGMDFENFQAIGLIADKNGSSAEVFAKGMARLNRDLNDAQNGSKEAAKRFTDLGISIEGAGKGEDILYKVADAAKASGDAGRIAMEVFGDRARMLGLVLENGSDGIKEMINQTKALGVVISEETAIKIGKLDDRMADLKKTAISLGASLLDAAVDGWDLIVGRLQGKTDAQVATEMRLKDSIFATNREAERSIKLSQERTTSLETSSRKTQEEIDTILKKQEERITLEEKILKLADEESNFVKEKALKLDAVKKNEEEIARLKNEQEAAAQEMIDLEDAYGEKAKGTLNYAESQNAIRQKGQLISEKEAENQSILNGLRLTELQISEKQLTVEEAISKENEQKVTLLTKEIEEWRKSEKEKADKLKKSSDEEKKKQKEIDDLRKKNAKAIQDQLEKTMSTQELINTRMQQRVELSKELRGLEYGSIEYLEAQAKIIENTNSQIDLQARKRKESIEDLDKMISQLSGSTREQQNAMDQLSTAQQSGDASAISRAQGRIDRSARKEQSRREKSVSNQIQNDIRNGLSEDESRTRLRNSGVSDSFLENQYKAFRKSSDDKNNNSSTDENSQAAKSAEQKNSDSLKDVKKATEDTAKHTETMSKIIEKLDAGLKK